VNKKLLVIDALNMYFRAYIVDPSLSTNGQPIGGFKGFIKIIKKLDRETKPNKIVICWDGAGGSQKRKSINKNYKEGRKPIRLNRDIRNLSESEEIQNKIWQQTRLIEYLNNTPIIQLVSEGVEADDVISYVNNMPEHRGWQKIIVSSDKDFFQLLDDETILYRPVQKEILNSKRIVEKFGIHPNNFAMARAIAGDKSDNLAGIAGVGLATIAKRFPFLREEKSYTIDELVEFCESEEDKLKVHTSIIEDKSTIEHNYKLMQLYSPSMSIQFKQKINSIVNDFKPEFNKTGIRTMLIEDGAGETNLADLFQNFRRICREKNE